MIYIWFIFVCLWWWSCWPLQPWTHRNPHRRCNPSSTCPWTLPSCKSEIDDVFRYFLKSLKIPNLLTQEFDLIGCAYSVYNPNLYFHAAVTHPKLEAGWVGLLWGGVNTTAFYKGAVFAPKYCITIMLQHTHFKVPDS